MHAKEKVVPVAFPVTNLDDLALWARGTQSRRLKMTSQVCLNDHRHYKHKQTEPVLTITFSFEVIPVMSLLEVIPEAEAYRYSHGELLTTVSRALPID
jgi:hypothetical protein